MAKKIRDYSKLAEDIYKNIGEASNLISVSRCATRLRLVLKETPQNARMAISSLPGVITVVENGGQFQIVIGPHVGEVYEAFNHVLPEDLQQSSVSGKSHKASVINRIIATMSAVFAPFVYILASAGILQGILIITKTVVPTVVTTGAFQVFDFISWTPFTFLPILIAITASKHFKCSPFIAFVCCAALVNPTWGTLAAKIAAGTPIRFIGIPLSQTTYTSTVLPAIFLVYLLSYLEKFIERKLPEMVRALFTPLLCMVIMIPLTLLIVGPLSNGGAILVATGYNSLVVHAPAVAGMLIGGFWQVIVIFGIHWGITPMCIANFQHYGKDSFQAFQTIAVVGQLGAVLGVFFKTRDKALKNISVSAGITALFGITEPAIYGVTLRYKKPFIVGCISGSIGALVMSFFHSYYYAYAGLPGLLTTVNGINSANPSSFIGLMVGCSIAIILPIVIIQIIGYESKALSEIKVDKLEN